MSLTVSGLAQGGHFRTWGRWFKTPPGFKLLPTPFLEASTKGSVLSYTLTQSFFYV